MLKFYILALFKLRIPICNALDNLQNLIMNIWYCFKWMKYFCSTFGNDTSRLTVKQQVLNLRFKHILFNEFIMMIVQWGVCPLLGSSSPSVFPILIWVILLSCPCVFWICPCCLSWCLPLSIYSLIRFLFPLAFLRLLF